MSVFALSDLHLSLSNPEKSMTVFGPKWDNYIERIRDSWTSCVTEDDTVLISGDISWATRIEDATEDFEFISSLPGRKLLSRGNHDYWWTTMSKMNEFFSCHDYRGIDIVRTNVTEVEGCLISGTRGWMFPTDTEFKQQDRKIYEREQARLRLCFDEMNRIDPERVKKRIIMMHYPPITKYNHPTVFTDIIRDGGADICIYGHLHGRAHEIVYKDEIFGGCRYLCTSGDYLGFAPLKVL